MNVNELIEYLVVTGCSLAQVMADCEYGIADHSDVYYRKTLRSIYQLLR